MMLTKRNCNLPLICLVCRDTARGINFNVMSCMSCKTFFRRHGSRCKINLICPNKNNCEINRQTRGACSACRLRKCLLLGMDPKQIGNRRFKQDKSKNMQQVNVIHPLQPYSSNLFLNDHSTLTRDEWDLLSNIIHAYDATNIMSCIKQNLQSQSSLPPKIRLKTSVLLHTMKQIHSTFHLLIERTPYYQYLSENSCQALVQRNSDMFSSLNSIFIIREISAVELPSFQDSFHSIYSHGAMNNLKHLMSKLDSNGIYIKIMLMIFAFSNTFSIVKYDPLIDFPIATNWISILNIQNIFVTMFWKYLLYQHGFHGTVRWFSEFVRYIVELMRVAEQQRTEEHYRVMNTVAKYTAHSLTLEDS